ncbi:ABC transporter permease subunit [Mesorhizobium sp. M1338]|uniref:ABC transporter permease subunit n=1 Tax=unclassified Mesorhizobium TaxID=325217 RepID=UPI00333BB6DF
MALEQANAGVARSDAASIVARRRRNRVKYQATQLAIVVVAIALVLLLGMLVNSGLAQRGINFTFTFLWNSAGFDISEGKTVVFDQSIGPRLTDFTADLNLAQAFVAGLFNTLKVAILGIVLSTVLGTLFGVGRLSTNWVVRNLCFWVVEFVRNTPLLIQIVFWYFAVVLQFPAIASAAKFYGVIISQQGLYLPTLTWQGAGDAVALVLLTACVVAIVGTIFDRGRARWLCCAVAVVVFALMLGKGTIAVDFPMASKFKASGGTSISPEMAALLLGIVFNSASYIAEIVRGAIDTLPKGQWEAAAALGLSRRDIVNDIILPQVFRVVLPSFGNQYISLTKNTALGIAIGYPDLFNIYGTVANQTGHSLEGIIIVMLAYLVISWIISAIVGAIDHRLNAVGAAR